MANEDTDGGGQAFPALLHESPSGGYMVPLQVKGMTLRDYFAAKAMAALLTQMTYGNQGQHCAMYDPNDRQQAISLAHLSYMAADAMLNAREGCVTAKAPLLEDDFGAIAGGGR